MARFFFFLYDAFMVLLLLQYSYAPAQRKQIEPIKNEPVKEFAEQSEVKVDRIEVQQGRQRFVDDTAKPGLAQLSVEEKVSRESKKYFNARMAAEAAFQSASFAAMAARAAVELSRTQTQGKGPRGGGGYDKVHPHTVQSPAQKSPSLSGGSTVTSIGSDAAHMRKGSVFDKSDEEDDIVWPPQPQPQRRHAYQRAASAMGTGGGGAARHGETTRPFQDGAPPDSNPQHRRHATELAGETPAAQRGQYVAPPYRRTPTGSTAAAAAPDRDTYASAAHAPRPYARIVSALERGKNEHIARHEEVRPMGTDARLMQERVYGAAPVQGQGHAPMNPERRANSVRTRR